MKQYIALLSIVVGLMACSRDKKDSPPAPNMPKDGRLLFVGTYDVYDTMSNWKYEMRISLHDDPDSLTIRGWNDDFDLSIRRESQDRSSIMGFGHYFGAADYQGHRWALYRDYDPVFGTNTLFNDTLRLSYLKDNIAFYVQDGVPYFSGHYREYAVKRDWE